MQAALSYAKGVELEARSRLSERKSSGGSCRTWNIWQTGAFARESRVVNCCHLHSPLYVLCCVFVLAADVTGHPAGGHRQSGRAHGLYFLFRPPHLKFLYMTFFTSLLLENYLRRQRDGTAISEVPSTCCDQ